MHKRVDQPEGADILTGAGFPRFPRGVVALASIVGAMEGFRRRNTDLPAETQVLVALAVPVMESSLDNLAGARTSTARGSHQFTLAWAGKNAKKGGHVTYGGVPFSAGTRFIPEKCGFVFAFANHDVAREAALNAPPGMFAESISQDVRVAAAMMFAHHLGHGGCRSLLSGKRVIGGSTGDMPSTNAYLLDVTRHYDGVCEKVTRALPLIKESYPDMDTSHEGWGSRAAELEQALLDVVAFVAMNDPSNVKSTRYKAQKDADALAEILRLTALSRKKNKNIR